MDVFVGRTALFDCFLNLLVLIFCVLQSVLQVAHHLGQHQEFLLQIFFLLLILLLVVHCLLVRPILNVLRFVQRNLGRTVIFLKILCHGI